MIFAIGSFAEGTRTWEQSRFDELSKGTATGVAVRSIGGLQLAPSFKLLYTSPSTYIWSIAADDAGNLYAAAGSPARLYRIGRDGKSTILFEPQELQIQTLVVDPSGVIYAATSPDGKVYRIEQQAPAPVKGQKTPPAPPSTAPWKSSLYFDPGTKYIWDLALDKSGDLYVATGDHGEIFRVLPNGEHSLFFKSDEAHIRVLAVDPKGNLIAGSDGSGLVYRISPNGDAFVLYSAPKKEITALAIDDAGNIYAAGVGEKRAGGAQGSATPTTLSAPIPVIGPAPSGGGITLTPAGQGPAAPLLSLPAPGVGASGSEVYRIAPDGSPLRIWTSQTDMVYALAFDDRGNLLAGTGNRGHIFAVTGQDEFIDLVQAAATQVTAFAKAPGGGLYASTSNLGKLFLIGPSPETQGTYESDVFDARNFSRWGRAQFRGTGTVQLFARSGNVDNPDRNWSAWMPVNLQGDARLPVPPARFVQWRAVLHAGNPSPRVDSIIINYLPKNVAPEIDEVTVQPGYRIPVVPKQPNVEGPVPMPAPMRDVDSVAVKWSAHDDNDDDLVYSVYYRADGENRWLLLKDGITDKYYSFDVGLLPDGGYMIRVVASDAPSHAPGDALSTDRQSSRFEVDTTPPAIQNMAATVDGDRIHLIFRAVDTFSPIKRAEYSVDAGDWQVVEPIDQISDNNIENYDFEISLGGEASVSPAPAPGPAKKTKKPAAPPATTGDVDHVIVVRAYDRFDNMGTAKAIIRAR